MKEDKVNQYVEETLKIAGQMRHAQAPEGIKAAVYEKIHGPTTTAAPYPYLRWAAVALLVVANAISYLSFLNDDTTLTETTTNDTAIENLLSEYQINEYVYNEY